MVLKVKKFKQFLFLSSPHPAYLKSNREINICTQTLPASPTFSPSSSAEEKPQAWLLIYIHIPSSEYRRKTSRTVNHHDEK